jgi:hypothetical protein
MTAECLHNEASPGVSITAVPCRGTLLLGTAAKKGDAQTPASLQASAAGSPAGEAHSAPCALMYSGDAAAAVAAITAQRAPVHPPRDPLVSAANFAKALEQWMDTSVTAPQATGCQVRDIFTLRQRPPLGLTAFVERAYQYAACEPTCFTVALALLHRALSNTSTAHPHAQCAPATAAMTVSEATLSASISREMCPLAGKALRLTPFNVHRLIAAAITLAIKSTQDVYHPMSYYGSVFGVGAVDLRKLEVALMTLLDHRLYVNLADAEATLAFASA